MLGISAIEKDKLKLLGSTAPLATKNSSESNNKIIKANVVLKNEIGDQNNGTVNHVLVNEGIETFLASNSRVLLIQGDAGTGKSIILKLIERKIYK